MNLKNNICNPKHFFINSGTFKKEILISINQSNETINKVLLKHFSQDQINKSDILNTSCAKVAIFYDNGYLIARFVNLNKNIALSAPVIAHEAFHITEFLFDKIGITYHIDFSSEAFSYQIEYYVNQIIKNITKS